MTLRINDITSLLSGIVNNTDNAPVIEGYEQALKRFTAGQMNVFNSPGDIFSGILGLTSNVDDASLMDVPTLTPGIGMLTKNIPGLENDLLGSVPSSIRSDLLAITETDSDVEDGFLEHVYTHTSPNAVASTLSSITGKSPEDFLSALQGLTTEYFQNEVLPAVSGEQNTPLTSALSSYISLITSKLSYGSGEFITDFGERVEKNYTNQVQDMVDRTVTTSDMERSFGLFVKNKKDDAFAIIKKYIELPDGYNEAIAKPRSTWSEEHVAARLRMDDIEKKYKDINVQFSSYSVPFLEANSAFSTISLLINNIGELPEGLNSLNSGSTESVSGSSVPGGEVWAFSSIKSADELEHTLRNVNRSKGFEIAGAIVHWTGTFNDQNVDAAWIHKTQKQNGYSGIGNHIIIKRDGTIQLGRSLNRVGQHNEFHDKNFIGIAFVGGLNTTSTTASKPYRQYESSKSFTAQQWEAYDVIMETMYKVFPHLQVGGNNMASSNGYQDPGFDVVEYSEKRFGHKNIIPEDDTSWKTVGGITIETIRDYYG